MKTKAKPKPKATPKPRRGKVVRVASADLERFDRLQRKYQGLQAAAMIGWALRELETPSPPRVTVGEVLADLGAVPMPRGMCMCCGSSPCVCANGKRFAP
jgi:hypothetical protein